MSTESAKEYWSAQSEYPFAFTRHRRIHELKYLVPRLRAFGGPGKKLLDLGCGDGALSECLFHLTEFEEYFGCDIAEDLLAKVRPGIGTFFYDLSKGGPLPKVDATIVAGVIQYIFEDDAVEKVLQEISSPVVFIRSTCTLKNKDEAVEKAGYASLYRTLPHTYELISRQFEIRAVDRVYPDEIESPFGTKQFYFEAHRRA